MKKQKIAGIVLALSFVVGGVVYSQTDAIDGKPGANQDQATAVMASKIKKCYESHEFALPALASDYNLATQQPAFRAVNAAGCGVPRAHTVTIRTDADILIKFNNTAYDGISLSALEGSMTWTVTEVTNIFLTSTPGANVKITLG